MRAIVASTNPIKIGAARVVFAQAWPEVEVVGRAVTVPISVQPFGHAETRAGAQMRAVAALALDPEARWGVGLEGGVVEYPDDPSLYTVAWCAIGDREGRFGWGGGVSMVLPPAVAAAVRGGAELGPAMDALTGLVATKQAMGAVGLLTDGLLDRQGAYAHLVAMALAPWRKGEWYVSESPESMTKL